MEWLADFRRASPVAASTGASAPPLVATLATVDDECLPRARSVVCRRVADDGSVWITADARSDKMRHLRHCPHGELVFWFPTPREQFRLFGPVEIIASRGVGPVRLSLWRGLSEQSRAMFFWPQPGAPRLDDDESFRASPGDDAPPDRFEVLVLYPARVEHLELAAHPHRRRRWLAEDGWREREINP